VVNPLLATRLVLPVCQFFQDSAHNENDISPIRKFNEPLAFARAPFSYQVPHIISYSSFIGFSLALLAAIVFADTSPLKTESRWNRTSTPAVLQSPAPKQGLNFVVGARGLDSLSFNGQSLLGSPESGALQPQKSVFRAVLDAVLPRSSSPVATPNKKTDTVDLSYPWGRVSCAYGKQEDRLTMRIEVSNTSSEPLNQFSIRLMELNFRHVPNGGTLEAGMFGFGFKGPEWPLNRWPPSIPSIADPWFVVPIVRADFGTGALNFCSDDLESSVGILRTTNPPDASRYPLVITCPGIEPGEPKTFNVSLRFGRAGSATQELSRDVLERYARKYPFQLNWTDRRPIGAIFLAGAQINSATNPRRWSFNAGKIDVSTEEGKRSFREALLRLVDYSISVLKRTNAQGMITWDPEGEEFLGACYYGDPRLVSRLAPEMELKGSSDKSVIDEYFEKFRAAGLKVGVCIRPQPIMMVDNKPVHQKADDERALQVLKEKIAYAKKRWGCTLFYVDSTATAGRSLDSDVFKKVADAYPDVLLIPENESMRYFAYSAPLNSYVHHRITSTPAGARMGYPQAFSVLMAPDGDWPEHHAALVDAVRRGDILLFNALYNDAGAEKIQKIYLEAGRQITPGGSLPNQ
jgi:hypothetical protein